MYMLKFTRLREDAYAGTSGVEEPPSKALADSSHNEEDYAVRSRRIIHIELGRGRRKPVDQVITRVFGVWCQWADGGSTEPARERRLFHHEDGPSNN